MVQYTVLYSNSNGRRKKTITYFDNSDITQGLKMPPKAEKLVPEYEQWVNHIVKEYPAKDAIVLMGKSMGSRVACHAVADSTTLPSSKRYAIVCFGYPLIGINKKIRDEVRDH